MLAFATDFGIDYSFHAFLDKIYFMFASTIRGFLIGNYRSKEILWLDKILRWFAFRYKKL
jgi:hypothetical protein